MSGASLHAAASTQGGVQEPMAPVGGWTLLEAALAVCPPAAALYRAGGEALGAAINRDLPQLGRRANRQPELRPDAWLTHHLLPVLCRRPELQLVGRHHLHDLLAPRIPVEPDVIRSACRQDGGDPAGHGAWVHLDFRIDHVRIVYDFPQTYLNAGTPAELIGARIEARCDGARASSAAPNTSAKSAGPAVRAERLRAWYRPRFEAWPRDEFAPTSAPTYEEDLEAATQHFGSAPRRALLRKIRREFWSDDELKTGPHRRRKRAPTT